MVIKSLLLMLRKSRSVECSAFTLLELIVVLAGLGILASLAIPNFLKYLEFAQVDEAKSLLNTAASECLQKLRSSPNDWKTHEPDALKTRSLPGRYAYMKDSRTGKELNTCEEIAIHDPASENDDNTYFPVLSFTITGGKLVKESMYFHPESEQACKSWGNCGGSPSVRYLKACFLSKETCENDLAAALAVDSDRPLGPMAWTGECTWPQTPCGCNKEAWACSQKLYFSSEEFEKCITDKATAACNAHRETLKNLPHTGPDPAGKCPQQTWWLNGTMFTLESDYQMAEIEEKKKECLIKYESWKEDKINQSSFAASGCTQSAYKCLVRNQMKVFEGTMTAPSDCQAMTPLPFPVPGIQPSPITPPGQNTTPTPLPSCGNPPNFICRLNPRLRSCSAWSKCMGLI